MYIQPRTPWTQPFEDSIFKWQVSFSTALDQMEMAAFSWATLNFGLFLIPDPDLYSTWFDLFEPPSTVMCHTPWVRRDSALDLTFGSGTSLICRKSLACDMKLCFRVCGEYDSNSREKALISAWQVRRSSKHRIWKTSWRHCAREMPNQDFGDSRYIQIHPDTLNGLEPLWGQESDLDLRTGKNCPRTSLGRWSIFWCHGGWSTLTASPGAHAPLQRVAAALLPGANESFNVGPQLYGFSMFARCIKVELWIYWLYILIIYFVIIAPCTSGICLGVPNTLLLRFIVDTKIFHTSGDE